MHFRITFNFKVEECREISRAALKGGINIQKIEQQSEMKQFKGSESLPIHLSPRVVFIGQTAQCTKSLTLKNRNKLKT